MLPCIQLCQQPCTQSTSHFDYYRIGGADGGKVCGTDHGLKLTICHLPCWAAVYAHFQEGGPLNHLLWACRLYTGGLLTPFWPCFSLWVFRPFLGCILCCVRCCTV